MNTDELLVERGKTHGEYSEHAQVTQAIMRAITAGRRWEELADEVKESLHMIAHKMGRVVTGNPYIKDHFTDIAGYARLVEQRINDEQTGIRPWPGVPEKLPAFKVGEHVRLRYNCVSIGIVVSSRVYSGIIIYQIQSYSGLPILQYSEGMLEKDPACLSYTPGTPEDGGHHARQVDAED